MGRSRTRRPIAAALLACLAACAPQDPPADPAQVMAAGEGRAWYRGNLHAHTLWSDGDAMPDTAVAWYRDRGYHFLALTEHDLVPVGERWIDGARVPVDQRRPSLLRERYPGNDGLRERDGRAEHRLPDHAELAARFSRPGAFLLLPGEEISDHVGPLSIHVNAINLAVAVPPARRDDVVATIEADFAAATAAAAGAPLLLQLNHPNFVHSVTAEQLMRVRGSPFFELYNGHPLSYNGGDGLRPSTERMWDIALAWRLDVLGLPPLYATATDDSHHYGERADAVPGRGWVQVLAPALEPAALFDAMRQGRFYASTGVALERIVATADRLEVQVQAEPGVDYAIEFIGTRAGFDARTTPPLSATGRPLYASHRHADAIGTVFARHRGTHATYRFADDDLYVRARITASRRHPRASQPLQYEQAWVQPVVGPAGGRPSRPGLAPPPAVPAGLHLGVTRRFQPLTEAEAAALLRPARGVDCAVDLVTDAAGRPTTAFARGAAPQFAGWLSLQGQVPDALAVVLHGDGRAYVGEGGPGRARPDVAQAYGKPALEGAGFHVDFEFGDTAPGDYRIALLGFRDGRAFRCDSDKALSLR